MALNLPFRTHPSEWGELIGSGWDNSFWGYDEFDQYVTVLHVPLAAWTFSTGLSTPFVSPDLLSWHWESLGYSSLEEALDDDEDFLVGGETAEFEENLSRVNDWAEFTADYLYNEVSGGSSTGTETGGLHFDGNYWLFDSPWKAVSLDNQGLVALKGTGLNFSLTRDGIIVPVLSPDLGIGLPSGYSLRSIKLGGNGRLAFQAKKLSNNRDKLFVASLEQDSDGDRMSDDWETYYNGKNGVVLNPNDASDADLDPDGDGRSNLVEFLRRWDPGIAEPNSGPNSEIDLRPGIDTDGDGMPNSWEFAYGLDYNNASDAGFDP